MSSYSIHVVLVRPIYASNIGATSRAMSNMGAERLILIDCKCEIDYSAQQAAASGQSALQNRVHYSSWDEFYKNEGAGVRIALTARDGRTRAAKDLKETLQSLTKEERLSEERQNLYLIFGPEDCGLNADDVKLAHFCCNIATYGNNTSLNLAQAVLLCLFVVRSEWGGHRAELDGDQSDKQGRAYQGPAYFPENTLKNWIEELGFDLSKKRVNAFTVIRRMLLHNTPTHQELRMLETVLQQNLRRLREK